MRSFSIIAVSLFASIGLAVPALPAGTAAVAQTADTKNDSLFYDGQIVKIDTRNKIITVKGPRNGLTGDDTPAPRGRSGGAASGGRGGRGSRGGGRASAGGSGSAGGDMRRLEDVERKIAITDKTEYLSDRGSLKLSDLRSGDYVTINARKNGRKIEAVTVKRISGAPGGNN